MKGKVMSVKIGWKDSHLCITEDVLICIGDLPKTFTDDNIFFYCSNKSEFFRLMGKDNGEDFEIIDVYGICI